MRIIFCLPRAICAVFLVVLLVMFGVQLSAQTVTGTINGTILDASGSVVPNAEITVTSQEKGTVRSTVGSAEGVYSVPQLQTGTYTLEVKASGFSPSQVKDVVVTVGSEVRVDLKLEVGSVDQAVTVNAEALPMVETTNAEVGQLMDQDIINDIPLNARDLLQLAEIQAGVQFNNYDNFGKQLIVAGSRGEENRFLQEGVDTTFTFRRSPVSSANIILGVEAVKEFKVLVGSYSAEYGEHVGGVVNTVFKSGSNEFHGSAYEFFRDAIFDERNYFDLGSAPPFVRNQFGASFGGPIRKDKTFFFGNYEGYRHSLGITNVTNVPDAQTRAGLIPCNTIPGTQPAACLAANGGTKNTRVPVPGTGLSPFISQVMTLVMPACTGPEVVSSTGNDTGACTNTNNPSQNIHENFYLVKMDHYFSANSSISSSYNFDQSGEVNPNQNPTFTDNYYWRKQIFSLQHTWLISPNIVNSLRFGGNRTHYFTWNSANVTVPSTINGSPVYVRTDPAYTPMQGVAQFPSVGLSSANFTSLASNGQTPRWLGYTMFGINDDVNYQHGKHAFQFGGEFKKWYDNTDLADGNYRGTYTFNSLPAFLQGTSQQLSYSVDTQANWGRSYATAIYGLYGQDTYKLKPNLTLTMGLRWEYEPGSTEKYGKVSVFGEPQDWSLPNRLPTLLGPGNRMFSANPHIFSPRVGINWDPFKDGKTSIRAGASIFHDQVSAFYWYHNSAEQYPLSTTVALQGETWPYNPATFNPNKLFISQGAFIPQVGLPAIMPRSIPKIPTKYNWDLEIQRELPGHIALMVGYVGAQIRHSARQVLSNTFLPTIQAPGSAAGCTSAYANVNPPTGYLATPACGCPPGGVSCLFWNTTNSGLNSPSSNAGNAFLPNNNFNTIQGTIFDANTFYNSLQATVDRRVGDLTVRFNYTHSSCITDVSDYIGTSLATGGASLQYTYDHTSSRMPCTTNARDFVNFSFAYDLPFGRHSSNAFTKTVIAGWTLNSLTSWNDGTPLDIALGFNNSHSVATGNGNDRPNLNPTCTSSTAVIDPRSTPTPFYINPNCFSIPSAGYLGNLGAGFITGPSYSSTDFSLRKKIALRGERMFVELRADMFNGFNHTNFRSPTTRSAFTGSGSPSGTFGQITGIIGTSRQFQMGARFQF